jgi:SAM-dependent methyltransferase
MPLKINKTYLSIKKALGQNKLARNLYSLLRGVGDFFQFTPLKLIKAYAWFFNQNKAFRIAQKNSNFTKFEYYPCLFDNTSHTPLDPTYFFQDSWAAKHIFNIAPKHHYDVGSSVKTMGIISQFTPTTIVDIRPIELELDNLFFKEGSVLALPFDDNSLETLSSLCVVEHIGLGRYGDEIDPFGSEKAVTELKRVLKVGGIILFSVPVDKTNTIYFNAHRAFTRSYILKLFDDFKLVEEKYHYGKKIYNHYDSEKGFGTGLYMLEKII